MVDFQFRIDRCLPKKIEYGLFLKEVTDYPGGGAPSGWARIPALRHAMATFKHSKYFWYLDQDAIIMNPALSIETHIVERLGSLVRRDVPIVPPESIIKTYRHVPPERVQFILTQDKTGLQPGSMLLKAGPWSHYLLDAWYDPLFRFYNFAKAEQNALVWPPALSMRLNRSLLCCAVLLLRCAVLCCAVLCR